MKYSSKYKQPCVAEYGKLDKLITQKLIDLCRNAKYVVIFGHTKSGKSHLTKLLSKALGDRDYIFSDWYMHYGFKNNMYVILDLLQTNEDPLLLEGIQMSRLLRKGIQENNFYPDVVIHVVCDYPTIEYCYIRDGERRKLRQNGRLIKHWNSMIDKIFFEWYDMMKKLPKDRKPTLIKIDTSISNLESS